MSELNFSTTSSLVVDSDKFSRTFIKNALSQLGCKQVKEASDAETASQLLSAYKYDVLLIDQNLEDKEGSELVKDLRDGKLGESPNMPVIMITSDATENAVKKAKNAGVNLYLVKPISPASLKKRISFLLGQK